MSRRTFADNRRAVILIAFLAVVAIAFGASKVLAHHSVSVQPSNPAGPLVGAIDQAKATAGAASRAGRQPDQQSGSPDVSTPANPPSTSAP